MNIIYKIFVLYDFDVNQLSVVVYLCGPGTPSLC